MNSAASGYEQVGTVQRVEQALGALPERLRYLNRVYLRSVANRSVKTAAETTSWLGQRVTTFLRHDKINVFAIVCQDDVGMADFVSLADVTFHVSGKGRLQSIAAEGPLPNRRTVHAFLCGRLVSVSSHDAMPDPVSWEPVWYRPSDCSTFVFADGRDPVHRSSSARLVPGREKVWCRRPGNTVKSCSSGEGKLCR